MYFDIIRNYSLNFDKSDPHYILLKKIFKIIDLRKSQTNDHFQGIKNIKKFTNALKILFIKKKSIFKQHSHLLQCLKTVNLNIIKHNN